MSNSHGLGQNSTLRGVKTIADSLLM
eukprot:COSAG02_NODE_49043_length_329_cov_1.326087_1_plen_25_part_10